MSEIPWGQYPEAYKAIHDKIAEVLAKLDKRADRQLTDIYALPTIGVMNHGQIINGDFEIFSDLYSFHGWSSVANCAMSSGANAFSGFKCITLKKASGPPAFNGLFQAFSPPIPTNDIEAFTLMFRDDDGYGEICLKVQLTYTDGTKTTQNISDPDMTLQWRKVDLTYSSNKYIISMRLFTDNDYFAEFNWLFVDAVTLRYKPTVVAEPLMPSFILAGQQTVTTAGTPVVLGSGALKNGVHVQAMSTNTGIIAVGNSSARHYELNAGEDVFLVVDDLAAIYIDAAVNGEGVNYIGS